MRVLHRLTMKETFVASGVYEFTRGAHRLAGREHWSIHQLPDGSQFVRIDADWRDEDGTSQLAEALVRADADAPLLERYLRHSYYTSHVERESYDFYGDHVLIAYDDDAGERQSAEARLPAGYIALLSMDILLGLAVARLAQDGQGRAVFLGYDTAEDEPLTDTCRVALAGETTLEIDGRPQAAREYTLSYDADPSATQRVWLAAQYPILLRRQGSDGIVSLVSQYAHRP